MLTNLDWIAPGKPFPPKSEEQRIKVYRENEKLFDGNHNAVFGKEFKEIEGYLKKRHADPMIIFNYPQLLTKKTADFVCGEMPDITVGRKSSDDLNGALDDMGFGAVLYEAVMDAVRFGDAPIKIMSDRISAVSPDCWFPIVDPTDLKRETHQVVAFPTDPDEGNRFRKIYVEIHTPGKVETREYTAEPHEDGTNIVFGNQIEESETRDTGLEECGVLVLKNVSGSKSIHGIDDFGIVKSIVQGLIWRIHCVDQVLNKHSEPSISIPQSAMTFDEKYGWYLDLGKAFVRNNKDDPDINYVTWDGNLESCFKEIEVLTNQLYVLSEMGAAFMDAGEGGTANSGTALKLRMVSPRIKARRIASINTHTVKKLIVAAAHIKGLRNIKVQDIGLTWNDGLPDDRKETAEILAMATGNKPFMSQTTATKEWGDFDDEAAQKEMDLIETEHAAQAPSAFAPMEIRDEQNAGVDREVRNGGSRDQGGD